MAAALPRFGHERTELKTVFNIVSDHYGEPRQIQAAVLERSRNLVSTEREEIDYIV